MRIHKARLTKVVAVILIVILGTLITVMALKSHHLMPFQERTQIKLPEPSYRSSVSVEEALKQRRSTRQFKADSLSLQQLSQLLWATQGITTKTGFRTAPSAGGFYPLEVYVISGRVKDLAPGVYHYNPFDNVLEIISTTDRSHELAVAAFPNGLTASRAVDLVITGAFKKAAARYGRHNERFVSMEAGHAAENLYLQATAMGLGTVAIGSFDETAVRKMLVTSDDPLYVMPVGKV
jgi:SagB-type dehydrogenase family enzyme